MLVGGLVADSSPKETRGGVYAGTVKGEPKKDVTVDIDPTVDKWKHAGGWGWGPEGDQKTVLHCAMQHSR